MCLARVDCHLERVDGEITTQRGRYLPADEATTEDIDHERDVDPAGMRLDAAEIRDPELVGGVVAVKC